MQAKGAATLISFVQHFSGHCHDYLRAVLAIDCLHPTFWHEGNTVRHIEHKWKQDLLRRRPDLVSDAYLALAGAGITRRAPHVNGLHELMNLEELKPRSSEVALTLLEKFPTAPPVVLGYLMPAAFRSQDSARLRRLTHGAIDNCRPADVDDARAQWLAIGFLLSLDEATSVIESLDVEAVKKVIWNLRDFSGMRHGSKGESGRLSLDQLEYLVRLTASHFPQSSYPTNGWSGSTNPWDATEFINHMINRISADSSERAGEVLTRLAIDPVMETYRDGVKHARAQQKVRRIDDNFRQPTWSQAVAALQNGSPANVADLHALVLAHLADLGPHIAATNTDIYKRFWNEDQHGQIVKPKGEESCRDVLVELLRFRLSPHGVCVEPEGHMASDKRADIVAFLPGIKVVIELKRDYHAEVWTAIDRQLDRFYTRDPGAKGFGIYSVFWYGSQRGRPIPKPPAPLSIPLSADEMQCHLTSLLPPEKCNRIKVFVVDVANPLQKEPRRRHGPSNRKKAKRPQKGRTIVKR